MKLMKAHVTCLSGQAGEKGTLTKGGKDLKFDGGLHVKDAVESFGKQT